MLINVDSVSRRIPQNFLGISHEWGYVEELTYRQEYINTIKHLSSWGSGPIVLRVGGGSTDILNDVPHPGVYQSMAELYRQAGTKFILGLNFYKGDVQLARRQKEAAHKVLPPESIITFEIGNEPNFYINKNGHSNDDYVRCCFMRDWSNFAWQLSCPGGKCWDRQFAGPVWGHIYMLPSTLQQFLSATNRFVEMVTIHWYKATSQTYNTAASLLDEGPIRHDANRLKELVKVANSWGKPLRVAEMNTISNSGRPGVSNVFSAALWTLDVSLEVAAAGSVGVNFHWGAGQNLYTAVLRWYKDNAIQPPTIRPPYYGYVMLQRALAAGSAILGNFDKWGPESCKIWPLVDTGTGHLRVVIINKDPHVAVTAIQQLNRKWGYGNGTLIRMAAQGDNPLSAASGITIAGQYYGIGGGLVGKEFSETVTVKTVDADLGGGKKGKQVRWEVYMPPGSAALLSIPKLW